MNLKPKLLLRALLVFTACWLAISWLRAIFSPHDPVSDPHGYEELSWLIILSLLHLILGLILLFVSRSGAVSTYFAGIVASAPILHLAGSPFELPWCVIIFTFPSIAILLAGIAELILCARLGPQTDKEP